MEPEEEAEADEDLLIIESADEGEEEEPHRTLAWFRLCSV